MGQQNKGRRIFRRFHSVDRKLWVVLTRRMHSAVTVSVKVESSLALLTGYCILGGLAALVVRAL